MSGRPIVALTTDFGSGSAYVAQLKGVLLSALPDAHIIDVSHDIAPQSIGAAELVLRGCAFAFPTGCTHVVVVDPGVGTERRPIAVQARGMTFVGPDNGVLGVALAEPGATAVVLDRHELFREPVSATFHGRDIFAPVAAELAGGLALTDVGTPIDDAVSSTLPVASLRTDHVHGHVLGADRFGNLLTNIPGTWVSPEATVSCAGRILSRHQTYGDAPADTLFALEGSDGYLEIAVRDGSARALLPDAIGGEVRAARG